MDEKSEFAAAVNAIVMSHKKLYDLLVAALEYYTPTSVGMPPRGKRISRILDCEANGSHALIEDLATAAKAVPRGELGELPDLLVAECRDFLDFLEEHLHCGECAAAINDIRQTEEAFVNLIKGVSGCDPNISVDDYSVRIDMFVRDLKAFFRDFGKAIVKLEYEIAQRRKTPEAIAAKTAARELFRQLLDGAHDAGDAPPKTAAAVKTKYDKSGTNEWTQEDAAKLLGISTRQLRRYKTKPPKDWPGWEDPIALKKWKINKDDRGNMAFAMKKSLSYKEGITEKRMKKIT